MMTLTAQYRPYRDEECVDGVDGDHLDWRDHEPGVQIYEKTTEDLPYANRRRSLIWIITLSALVGAIGFLIGYFSHTTHSECIHNKVVALDAVRDQDPKIRAKLSASIDPQKISMYTRQFAAKPRLASTEDDYNLALKVHHHFQANHFHKSVIKSYDVLLSLPNRLKPNFISLVDQNGVEIYTSLNSDEDPMTYSPYSPNGDVTGDLMFVNYGRPVDYLQLQEFFNTSENIFKGKILLIKQYHLPACEQYKYAMAMNASAVLFYPDPQHYNPNHEKPFPDTIWLPPNGTRRDAIFWNGAGDPETFGLPSNSYAFRDRLELLEQTSIPAQPISYQTAFQLMQRMQGQVAPSDWKGGFNITYRVGPGMVNGEKVRVVVNNQLVNRTVHNVVGTIRGRVEPDRYILLGSQRDSFTHGAIDSATGTAIFLELARVFGVLVREGWAPRRTILFCSWGAEEFNLIGSTEFVEEALKILYMRAVAYINVNPVITGNDTLSVAASPLLYHVIFNATKEVYLPKQDDFRPENFNSVYDKWAVSMPSLRNTSSLVMDPNMAGLLGITEHLEPRDPHHFQREEPNEPGSLLKTYLDSAFQQIRPHIRALDMYSSYAPFYTIAGIPVLDITYIRLSQEERENHIESDDFEKLTFHHLPYPLLHTQYDTVEGLERFVDPNYEYHGVITKILAEVVEDLADSLFIPFNIFDYAQLLKDFYLKTVHLHSAIMLSNKKSNLEFMYLELKTLESAVQNFTNEAIRFHSRQDKMDLTDPMLIRRVNDQILWVERQFLDHRGIPNNNLKKHLVLSPAELITPLNHLDNEGLFPALSDELDQIIGNLYKKDIQPSLLRLQKHLPILINTIQSAAESLAFTGDYF